jgi:uncharacterized protein
MMKLDDVVMGTAAKVELNPEPIKQKFIISGNPVARSKIVGRSRDWASTIIVWDCTAGSFYWHYGKDEVIIITSGEFYLLGENGEERCFSAGDYGFFPAGSFVKWRVDKYIRKVALLREPMWRPVGFAVKGWNKVVRDMGLHARTPIGVS